MTDQGSYRVSEEEVRSWLDALLAGGWRVVATVVEDGIDLPRLIASGAEAVLRASGKTRWSPREWLLPRSERLFGYSLDGGLVRLCEPPRAAVPQVLFGVRACDAAGLVRIDDNLLTGDGDPLYAERRERTTVVTAVCAAADPECFCTAVGGSPAGEEGSDVQLLPAGEGWLIRVLTERGQALVAVGSGAWTTASADDERAALERARRVAADIRREPVPREWGGALEEAFSHPVWEKLGERCLRCGVCAYVCPSCWCFDMNHRGDAWSGDQWRSWDSCAFAMFTRHASGHNPRAVQGERYRQRVLHKFAYGSAERFRCVGCGRCTLWCPAGLDIAEALGEAARAVLEEAADGGG